MSDLTWCPECLGVEGEHDTRCLSDDHAEQLATVDTSTEGCQAPPP